MNNKQQQQHGTLENVYDEKVTTLLEQDPKNAVEYMLDSFRFIQRYTEDDTDKAQTEQPSQTKANGFDAAGFKISGGSSKHLIYSQFMAEVENDYTALTELQPKVRATNRGQYSQEEWVCDECRVPKVHNSAESCIVCPSCGVTMPFVEMSQNNLTFDEQISLEVSSNCAYKRANHFSEWLISLQARESTVIPDEVLDAVRLELKKARFTTCNKVTPDQVKKFLKKLRLSRWYEHTHAICHALGTPAPRLSPMLEQKLKSMFLMIQDPFNRWVKVVAPRRKNFLSYAYVLFKFCELLGEDELLQYFVLLKSTEKLRVMDAIWQKICQDLNWEYIPSC